MVGYRDRPRIGVESIGPEGKESLHRGGGGRGVYRNSVKARHGL